MTIEEAIRILRNLYRNGSRITTPADYIAFRMSIDALVAVRAARTDGGTSITLPLANEATQQDLPLMAHTH